MQEQAQLRLKKEAVQKLGAEVYVILAQDLYRTRVFKEENLVLSTFKGPFQNEPSLVFGTALSDAAGYASALYGVSRKCLRVQTWVENSIATKVLLIRPRLRVIRGFFKIISSSIVVVLCYRSSHSARPKKGIAVYVKNAAPKNGGCAESNNRWRLRATLS